MYRTGYLLVGQPRRATGYLGEALTGTGLLGRPEEFFWRGQEEDWAERLGVSSLEGEGYGRYVEAVVRYATTPNGVFGAKMFWLHVEDLLDRLEALPRLAHLAAPERFRAILPGELYAVHIQRNCLDAAMSLWRAELTGAWSLRAGGYRPAAPERLDVARVSALHESQHTGDDNWSDLLHRAGLPRVTIEYEEIVEHLGDVVSLIGGLVGENVPSAAVATPSLLRQADDATRRFAREWSAATGGCEACTARPH